MCYQSVLSDNKLFLKRVQCIPFCISELVFPCVYLCIYFLQFFFICLTGKILFISIVLLDCCKLNWIVYFPALYNYYPFECYECSGTFHTEHVSQATKVPVHFSKCLLKLLQPFMYCIRLNSKSLMEGIKLSLIHI